MKYASLQVKHRKALAIALAISLIVGTGFIGMTDEPISEPLDEYGHPADVGDGIIHSAIETSVSINSASVFNVADSVALSNALMQLTDGDVINITNSFAYTSPIVIDGVSVELNLGSNTLTIEIYNPPSPPPIPGPPPDTNPNLSIQGGATLNITGSGTLKVVRQGFGSAINVKESTLINTGAVINASAFGGASVLSVNNGTAELTGLFTDQNAPFSYSILASGGAKVTVNGNISSSIYADSGAKVTVNGNITNSIYVDGVGTVVTVNGDISDYIVSYWGGTVIVNGNITVENRYGVSAWGGTVTVNGNITSENCYGVSAWGGTVTVNGNITGENGYGVLASGNGMVTVNGNITFTGPECVGVFLRFGGENNNNVTVNGTITASEYITYSVLGQGITVLTADQYDAIIERDDNTYRQYTSSVGSVYVRRLDPWQPPDANNRFSDVPNAPNWQNAAVSWADKNGITTGSPANSSTFKPNDTVTRAEFVTFFHRMYGSPSAPRATFTDMPENTAFQNAISWASVEGITTGSPAGSNTFMPNDNITREQIAAMLHRYIGGGVSAPADRLGGYTDQDRISTWTGAREAVNWAVYYGIMGRNVTELNPRGNATRAEAVTMLYRVAEIFNIPAP